VKVGASLELNQHVNGSQLACMTYDGTIMNSWKANRPPACEPPFKTFMNGTGRTYGFLVPAKSDMCAYNGTPFSTAAAFATAMLTPKMAFAPSFVLFGVPSRLLRNSSTLVWSLRSIFSLIRAGAMTSLTLATALVTPVFVEKREY